MNQKNKDIYFNKSSAQLRSISEAVKNNLSETIIKNNKIKENLPKINNDDKIVQQKLFEYNTKRIRELETSLPSPYFVKCFIEFENKKKSSLSFGKFSFSEKDIYSWITPASSIRFEKPGPVSYTQPNGVKKFGILYKKDQYLITEGKIKYLSTESLDNERELIYQAYFSQQKKDFLLPEIVAQMEKTQDIVIRANHKGSFLISGPAGSGKTALALHRVAYLIQSPDVSEMFKPESIIVFVQDEGTRDYFSHLLPQLGINNVKITTFAHWAMQVLDISKYKYIFRFGNTEQEKDIYEFKKYESLQNLNKKKGKKDFCSTLNDVYSSLFSSHEKKMLRLQLDKKLLDRFDLTILLKIYKEQHKTLSIMQEYYQLSKNGSANKKIGRFPILYSLIIFDEFQNYTSEQIKLIKSTLDTKNNALMYIGDMAQQTQFGTVKDLLNVGEQIDKNRKVVLQKVYRNSKQILSYISSLGYNTFIDENTKNGPKVIEKKLSQKKKK